MGGCTTNKSHIGLRKVQEDSTIFLNWTTIIDDGDNKDSILHAQIQFLFSTKLSTF